MFCDSVFFSVSHAHSLQIQMNCSKTNKQYRHHTIYSHKFHCWQS